MNTVKMDVEDLAKCYPFFYEFFPSYETMKKLMMRMT